MTTLEGVLTTAGVTLRLRARASKSRACSMHGAPQAVIFKGGFSLAGQHSNRLLRIVRRMNGCSQGVRRSAGGLIGPSAEVGPRDTPPSICNGGSFLS